MARARSRGHALLDLRGGQEDPAAPLSRRAPTRRGEPRGGRGPSRSPARSNSFTPSRSSTTTFPRWTTTTCAAAGPPATRPSTKRPPSSPATRFRPSPSRSSPRMRGRRRGAASLLEALALLARACGTAGLIGGQMDDLKYEGIPATPAGSRAHPPHQDGRAHRRHRGGRRSPGRRVERPGSWPCVPSRSPSVSRSRSWTTSST